MIYIGVDRASIYQKKTIKLKLCLLLEKAWVKESETEEKEITGLPHKMRNVLFIYLF
jgi:hypothetical protein